MSLPIALQLYTVRDALAKDFEGTLKEVAAIGYQNVELAGLYNRTPAQVRAALDQFHLRAIGAHVGIENLRDHLDAAIADAKTLGYKFITCPHLSEAYRNPQQYRVVAKIIEQAHRQAAPQGFTVSYHNHSFEYLKLADGSTGMDILFADPGVNAELDVYWVTHGGDHPVSRMRDLSGRVPLLHIKDMEKGEKRGFAEVGTGIIDMKAILAAAPGCGVKHLIIEQDGNWKGTPLESARTSFNNLKKLQN